VPQFGELMPPLQGTTGKCRQPLRHVKTVTNPGKTTAFSRTGYPVPRVVVFPYGDAIWVFDGKQYPWLSTHMRDMVPFFMSL